MHHFLVFALHKSECSWPRRSKHQRLYVAIHLQNIKFRNLCHNMGTPWLATGSYFVRTEPRPPRSILNRSRTPNMNLEIQVLRFSCLIMSVTWIRPIVYPNIGFQQQLRRLESLLAKISSDDPWERHTAAPHRVIGKHLKGGGLERSEGAGRDI